MQRDNGRFDSIEMGWRDGSCIAWNGRAYGNRISVMYIAAGGVTLKNVVLIAFHGSLCLHVFPSAEGVSGRGVIIRSHGRRGEVAAVQSAKRDHGRRKAPGCDTEEMLRPLRFGWVAEGGWQYGCQKVHYAAPGPRHDHPRPNSTRLETVLRASVAPATHAK